MTKIKMFWWNEQPNFGDALNPILLKRLFGVEAVWADMHSADLVGAGSCLQWVAAETKKQPREITYGALAICMTKNQLFTASR